MDEGDPRVGQERRVESGFQFVFGVRKILGRRLIGLEVWQSVIGFGRTTFQSWSRFLRFFEFVVEK